MTPAETPIERCPSMRRTRGVASLVRLAVAWWIVVLSVVSGPGCQSAFTIKVEKLRGVSGRWDNGADGALSSVYDVLTQLDRLCSECRATYGDEAVSKLVCPLPQTQQEIRDLLALSETLSQRRMKGEIGGHVVEAHVHAAARPVGEGDAPAGLGRELLQGVAGAHVVEIEGEGRLLARPLALQETRVS